MPPPEAANHHASVLPWTTTYAVFRHLVDTRHREQTSWLPYMRLLNRVPLLTEQENHRCAGFADDVVQLVARVRANRTF